MGHRRRAVATERAWRERTVDETSSQDSVLQQLPNASRLQRSSRPAPREGQKWPVSLSPRFGYFSDMRVDVGGATATGRRSENQDRWAVGNDQRWAMVCDGVGGAAGGSTAADVTVTAAARALAAGWPVEAVFAHAHGCVVAAQQAEASLRRMATTLTMALRLANGRWVVAAAGDSPAFLLGAAVQRLLSPHTVADELAAAGAIRASDVATHPGRNRVTRAIGHSTSATPDSVVVDVPEGASLVLASDGIDVLDAATMKRIDAGAGDAGCSAANLVDAALAAGASDNVTVVVLRPTGPVAG